MTAQLVSQSYGKSQVRISRITRHSNRHEFIEVTADISLQGDFATAYTGQDNQAVIPTDTMKNTAYALAHENGISSIESYAVCLGQHFLDTYSHVNWARITLHEHPWLRWESKGEAHPHCFVSAGSERHWCQATCTRMEVALQSGLTGLQVLKTTDSGFAGFRQDGYTTLPETDDRIFATAIDTRWPCADLQVDWSGARTVIRAALLQVFAEQFSPSVQATLFQMAAAAFERCAVIDEISITMPNQHHALANLDAIGISHNDVTFIPSSEPFGLISATVRRGGD